MVKNQAKRRYNNSLKQFCRTLGCSGYGAPPVCVSVYCLLESDKKVMVEILILMKPLWHFRILMSCACFWNKFLATRSGQTENLYIFDYDKFYLDFLWSIQILKVKIIKPILNYYLENVNIDSVETKKCPVQRFFNKKIYLSFLKFLGELESQGHETLHFAIK